MAALRLHNWHDTDSDVTNIEHLLSVQWKDALEETSTKVAVRTSIFNLVVYTQDECKARQVADDLTRLSGRQPSRSIILVGERANEDTFVDVEARVVSGAGEPGRQLTFHEQVLVIGRGRSAAHLSSVIIPLLLSEIPTYLWWPGQPLFGHRVLHGLLGFADQFVVDSTQFPSPGDGLAQVARLLDLRQGVNDFNWGRLRPWREVIAQFFDGASWLPYLFGISHIQVEFGAGGGDAVRATSSILLLLGWLASHVGWEPESTLDGLVTNNMALAVTKNGRPIEIALRLVDQAPVTAGRLMGITIDSHPAGLPPATFKIVREKDMHNVTVHVCVQDATDITRVVPLDLKTDAELLVDELEQFGTDAQYGTAVEMASRLAGREVWTPT
jgi:glucose-6-phosphate dehydrogenase assembly protein OpcA